MSDLSSPSGDENEVKRDDHIAYRDYDGLDSGFSSYDREQEPKIATEQEGSVGVFIQFYFELSSNYETYVFCYKRHVYRRNHYSFCSIIRSINQNRDLHPCHCVEFKSNNIR